MFRPFSAHIRLRFAAALLAMCAGCQHVPLAPIDPAANRDKIAARSLSAGTIDDALARHSLPVANGSWSLDQLTLAAWTLRTDVAVARAEVGAARAKTGVDSQRKNPSVQTTTEKVISGGPDPWVLGAALAMTFELGGKRDIRRETALAGERAAEWAFGETLWGARAEVRSSLLDVAFANAAVTVDGDEARLAREYLDWVDTRLQYGAATTAERLAAVQVLNESTSRRELDAVDLARADARLAAAIGVTSTELARVQPELPPIAGVPAIADADVSTARDLALVNRLDVRRALEDYAIAEQDLRAAVATQYPDLTLAPGYLLDQADHKITLGMDLPVPLFHNANATIQRAIAERAVAAAKFDDTQAAALAAIDVAVSEYHAARAALAAVEQGERDAADTVTQLQRRLDAGGANRGQLLAGEIALAGLRRSTLTARRALLDSVTALEQGVERPLYPASQIDTGGALRELLVVEPAK
jgi:outer membrane protein TolC